jgi:heat-inducible transcriptional repressor
VVDLIVISNLRLRLLIRFKMLTARRETILKSIVGQYIMRATPVASQSIVSDHDLGVCPATIRSEMAYLEEAGYITRQHPSAGSIPSDKGYRYYVESLGEIELPLVEQILISHLFHQVERELEEWLRLAAKLIAQLVHNMAVVTTPKTISCRFQYLEVVSLQDSLSLGIFVLRGARVKQRLINFDETVSQSKLASIANRLNGFYSGLTRSEILTKGIELSPVEQQITDYLLKIMQAEDEQESEEPYLDGLHFMFSQPEFTQSRRMKSLVELIDQRNLVKIIAPEGIKNQGLQVVIGRENRAEAIQDYSVILGRYGLADEAAGTIGVIGPTRMPYARAIATISYLSSLLSRLTADLYGKEPV